MMKYELGNFKPASLTKINTRGALMQINSYELIESILLFILSGICYMEYLISPFGTAFFSVLFYRKKRFCYVFFSLLGMLSAKSPVFFFKYVGSVLIIITIMLIFSKEIEHKKRLVSYVTTGAVFSNGIIYVITEGFFAFDFMLLLLECALVLFAFFVFDKALLTLKAIKTQKARAQLDILSVVALLGTVVFGVSLTENFWPIAHIGAVFIILLLNLTYGFGIGTATGAVFGFAISFCSPYPSQMICIYTLSSLFSGLFAQYGRLAASGVFAFSSLSITLLLCPEANGILTVSYVLAACLLLFFVPEKLLLTSTGQICQPRKEALSAQKVKESTALKITETIDTVNSVGTIFNQVIESFANNRWDKDEAVLDATAENVCKKCSLCRFCWNKDREKTRGAALRMYSVLETKGTLAKKDVPKDFSEMCIRSDAFVCELNKNFESHKVTKMWAGKVIESKRLIAEQFKNISMILNNLRTQIAEKTDFIPDAERRIAQELNKRGVTAEKIFVYQNDGYHVAIERLSCDNNNECDTLVPEALSEVLGKPFIRETAECGHTLCNVKFSEKPKLKADTAIACITKKNSTGSGDTASIFNIEGGKLALVLADGMGSGEMANFQSNVAVELVKKLLGAGFNKETCVRLINDILMTNSDKDTFSTIDLSVINLYTGQVEFIKTGSANSYLQLCGNNDTIKASSLPAGLVQDVEPDVDKKYVSCGDWLIMATDGVTDILDTDDKNEIFALTEDFDGTAQELADMLLALSVKKSGGYASDDMTVAVCKILNNI